MQTQNRFKTTSVNGKYLIQICFAKFYGVLFNLRIDFIY